MPLFRGFTPHIDPHLTLSYLVEAGGSHGQRIWNFFNSDYAYGDTIQNILTFEFDDRDWRRARGGSAIKANLRLYGQKSSRGCLTCSKTGSKFTKVVQLLPFRHIPVRVRMFKPWGSVSTESILLFDPPDIPPQIDINMIPVTRQEELPFDAPYPTTLSREVTPNDQSSQTEFSLFIEPTQSSSQLNSTEPLDSSTLPEAETSMLHSGLFVQNNTGKVSLIAKRSDTPIAALSHNPHFSPMAVSTSETPTNTTTRQPDQNTSKALRVRIPEADASQAGPSTAPPGFYQQTSPASREIELEQRSRSCSPPRKKQRSSISDPNYVVKRHKITNSGKTLTREEALANRVRTPTPPTVRFRTPTPPVRATFSNNNTPEKNQEANVTISPIRPRSNITINLSETQDTEEENQREDSMEAQSSEATAFLMERIEAARAMNSFIDSVVASIRIPQMMNATLPAIPNPNWQDDPSQETQDIIPEHVALVVHAESNTILRSLFFWERHDPWQIIQSMVHEDVILYPNGHAEDSDIMDPRPWSPTHVPISSNDATAGSPPSQSHSVIEIDSASSSATSSSATSSSMASNMSMTCITISSGQSSSSISDMSVSEVRIPEHDPHVHDDQEGREGGRDGEEGGEGHAIRGRHSHAD